MKIEIVFKSSKNTRKIAESMGKALSIVPKKIESDTQIEYADVLFLGCGIYAGDVKPEVKDFIKKLNPEKIKKIVLFTTSGHGNDQTEKLKEKIKECGLNLSDKVFSCKGQAFMFISRNKPDSNDLKDAAEFCQSIIK